MVDSDLVTTPLHQQIADRLRKEIIASGEPGARFGGDKILAKRFGVSSVTIREALLTLCNEGLLTRRRGSGTFVAEDFDKAQKADGEKHIAVLIDKDISHPRLSYAHRRVSEVLLQFFEEHGLPVKRYTGRKAPWEYGGEPTCDEFINAVQMNQIRAVAMVMGFEHSKWAEPLHQRNVPIIGAWGSSTCAVFDYVGMVRSAIDHLYKDGRKDIALLEWHDEQHNDQNIYTAFRKIMQEYGLPVHEKWIRRDLTVQAVGAGWGGFREIWSASYDKPNGLIVIDDMLFQDAASAILEIGIRVPEELTVITHANKNSGMFYPLNVSRMEVDPDTKARKQGEITRSVLSQTAVNDINPVVGFCWIDGQGPDLAWQQTYESTNLDLAISGHI